MTIFERNPTLSKCVNVIDNGSQLIKKPMGDSPSSDEETGVTPDKSQDELLVLPTEMRWEIVGAPVAFYRSVARRRRRDWTDVTELPASNPHLVYLIHLDEHAPFKWLRESCLRTKAQL